MQRFLNAIEMLSLMLLCTGLAESSRRFSKMKRDVSPGNEPAEGRILGGKKQTTIIPFLASLQANDKHICGAIFITCDYLLTAAHCLIQQSNLKIRFNSLYITESTSQEENQDSSTDQTEELPVSDIIMHSNFNESSTYSDDIALLKVNRSGSECSTVKFPSEQHSQEGTNVTLYGWGTTEVGGVASNHLKKIDFNIWPSDKCVEAYKKEKILFNPEMHVCALGIEGHDACSGDSGGPLVHYLNNEPGLVGITSFGKGCAKAGLAGAYTKVFAYLEWIQEKIGLKIVEADVSQPKSTNEHKHEVSKQQLADTNQTVDSKKSDEPTKAMKQKPASIQNTPPSDLPSDQRYPHDDMPEIHHLPVPIPVHPPHPPMSQNQGLFHFHIHHGPPLPQALYSGAWRNQWPPSYPTHGFPTSYISGPNHRPALY